MATLVFWRLELLVGMAVDHRQVVVVILLAHKPARVLAEGAHLIFEGGRIPDELGFIEHLVDPLHHFVAHLYPHADIHRAGLMGDAVGGAKLFQPIRAPAAGGHHHPLGHHGFLLAVLLDAYPFAHIPLQHQVGAFAAKAHFYAPLLQMPLNGQINILGLLGA